MGLRLTYTNTTVVNIGSDTITQLKKKSMNWMLTNEEETKIETHYPEIDMNCLKWGCLTTKKNDNYMTYLENRDNEKCQHYINKKQSLFYSVGFIKFDNKSNKPYYTKSR
jgi:hypothetical protein